MWLSLALFIWIVMGMICRIKSKPWSSLPEVTRELCPNTCVWKNNAKFSSAFNTSCCKECSCDADCGSANNCCFSELDNRDSYAKFQQSCTTAATTNTKNLHPSYFMISRNPRNGCLNVIDSRDRLRQCGEFTVAAWGSLYPVLSTTTGNIYRNDKCAMCHNDTKFVYWDPLQVCEKKSRGRDIKQALNVTFVLEHFTNIGCHFAFEVKGFGWILDRQRCEQSPVSHCRLPTRFKIPDGIDLTKRQIENACTSGFNSLFQSYMNVFCWICSSVSGNFPKCDSYTQNRYGQSILVVLDMRKLNKIEKENGSIDTKRQACKQTKPQRELECIVVHCPPGQIRTISRCEFIAKQWRQTQFLIYLNLKPIEGNSSDTPAFVEKFIKQNFSNILKTFIPYSWRNWEIRRIYMKEPSSNITRSWFLHVQLRLKRYMVDPQVLFQETHTSLGKDFWELKDDTIFVKFAEELASYNPFQKMFPYTSSEDNELKFIRKAPGLESTNFRPLPINKLFFCEQIELQRNMFELSQFKDVLYYNGTKSYFLNNEFTLYDSASRDIKARICLSDSLYTYMSSVTGNQYSLLLVFVLMFSGTDGFLTSFVTTYIGSDANLVQ